MNLSPNKIMIIFPYSGFSDEPHKEAMFFRMLDTALHLAEDQVLVVINQDTKRRSKLEIFENKIKEKEYVGRVEPLYVWAVDTCQMWLHGWGHIIDNHPGRRIVQLPGDLASVTDPEKLFNHLETFINLGSWPMIVGDFYSYEERSAKDLIDEYGTFPLMANWFPDIARAISKKNLKRPRTEFINIDQQQLTSLLMGRKFAYEQTLNFLIQMWFLEPGSCVRSWRVQGRRGISKIYRLPRSNRENGTDAENVMARKK